MCPAFDHSKDGEHHSGQNKSYQVINDLVSRAFDSNQYLRKKGKIQVYLLDAFRGGLLNSANLETIALAGQHIKNNVILRDFLQDICRTL